MPADVAASKAGAAGYPPNPITALGSKLSNRRSAILRPSISALIAEGQRSGFLPKRPAGMTWAGRKSGLPGIFAPRASVIKRNVVSASFQFRCQSKRGEHVPPGATGCEYVMAVGAGWRSTAHLLLSLSDKRELIPGVSRVRNGLRRVIASSSPTVRHTAMVDEPP